MDERTYLIIKFTITILLVATAAILCLMISYHGNPSHELKRLMAPTAVKKIQPTTPRKIDSKTTEKSIAKRKSRIPCDAKCGEICPCYDKECQHRRCVRKPCVCEPFNMTKCYCTSSSLCHREACEKTACDMCDNFEICPCLEVKQCGDERCAPNPCSCPSECECTTIQGACVNRNCSYHESCPCDDPCECLKGRNGCGWIECPAGSCNSCNYCTCERKSLNQTLCEDEGCAPLPICDKCYYTCPCRSQVKYCKDNSCTLKDCKLCYFSNPCAKIQCGKRSRRTSFTCQDDWCLTKKDRCSNCTYCHCDMLTEKCPAKDCEFMSPCLECFPNCTCKNSPNKCGDRERCFYSQCKCYTDEAKRSCDCDRINEGCDDPGCQKKRCLCLKDGTKCPCEDKMIDSRCEDNQCLHVMIVQAPETPTGKFKDTRFIGTFPDLPKGNCNFFLCGGNSTSRSFYTAVIINEFYDDCIIGCHSGHLNVSNTVEYKRYYLRSVFIGSVNLKPQIPWFFWQFDEPLNRIVYDGRITQNCLQQTVVRYHLSKILFKDIMQGGRLHEANLTYNIEPTPKDFKPRWWGEDSNYTYNIELTSKDLKPRWWGED